MLPCAARAVWAWGRRCVDRLLDPARTLSALLPRRRSGLCGFRVLAAPTLGEDCLLGWRNLRPIRSEPDGRDRPRLRNHPHRRGANARFARSAVRVAFSREGEKRYDQSYCRRALGHQPNRLIDRLRGREDRDTRGAGHVLRGLSDHREIEPRSGARRDQGGRLPRRQNGGRDVR